MANSLISLISVLILFSTLILVSLSGYVLLLSGSALLRIFRWNDDAPSNDGQAVARFIILITANNEDEEIEKTVQELLSVNYPTDKLESVLLTDHCSDVTAQIAEGADCTVLEWGDEGVFGKAEALHWAMANHLSNWSREFDAIAVVDAGASLSTDFFWRMNHQIQNGVPLLQARYKVAYEDNTWFSSLRELSSDIDYYLRPLGRDGLGLSSDLYDSGFVISRRLLEKYGVPSVSTFHGNGLGYFYTMRGIKAKFVPQACVQKTELMELESESHTNQHRTLNRLRTIRRWAPSLLKTCIYKQDISALDSLVEIFVPQLGLLICSTGTIFVLAVIGSFFIPGALPELAMVLAVVALASQVLYTTTGLALTGASGSTWRDVLLAPFYAPVKIIGRLSNCIKRFMASCSPSALSATQAKPYSGHLPMSDGAISAGQATGWQRLLDEVNVKDALYHIKPAAIDQPREPNSTIEKYLQKPISMDALSTHVNADSQVVILADDATRPTPQHKLLPPLLNHLNRAGVDDDSITIIIALGTHRYMSRAGMRKRFGLEICSRVNILNHTWRDQSSLTAIGELDDDHPLEINKIAIDADFLIGVGSIVPHIWAGWGGGSKIVLPGISSALSIAPTHAKADEESDLLGISGRTNTICRQNIEQAARKAGLDMILNCVVDAEGQTAWIGAGDPLATHQSGVAVAKDIFMRDIPQQADIVVADARPAVKDYWQGVKALAHATRGTKPGGVIILAGSFPNGISSTHPEFADFADLSAAEIKQHAQNRDIRDPVIITTLKLHTTICDQYNVICLSDGLTPGDKSALGFQYAESPSEALSEARKMVEDPASLGIIEFAGNVIADNSSATSYNTD